jgi:hypothetical protein
MSNFKIPFGLKKKRLVEVEEVLSGLRCGCVCPGCKKDLIARKGEVNAHHFAHAHIKDGDLCEYGAETAIHLMAKQIICEEKAIFAPSTVVEKKDHDDQGRSHSASREAHREGTLVFDVAASEQSLGAITPDILASIGEEQFIVEVAVTHFCDKSKISECRKNGYNVLEIDLKAFTKTLPTKDSLRKYIIGNASGRTWLSLKSYGNVEKQVERELQEKIAAANLRFEATVVKKVQRPKTTQQLEAPHRFEPSTYSEKNVKKRWFVCLVCKENQKAYASWQQRLPEEIFLFSCTLEESPWDIANAQCPFCNSPVAVNQGLRRPSPD